MWRLVVCIIAASLASASTSEARPSTTTMSCAQAAATVARAGAIVLTTGPSTYERFAASSAECLPGEIAEAAHRVRSHAQIVGASAVIAAAAQLEPASSK